MCHISLIFHVTRSLADLVFNCLSMDVLWLEFTLKQHFLKLDKKAKETNLGLGILLGYSEMPEMLHATIILIVTTQRICIGEPKLPNIDASHLVIGSIRAIA